MRRFLKISGILFISIVGFALLIALLVKAFENTIAHQAAQRISRNYAMPIAIASVDFNLLRAYPNSQIELNNIWLKNQQESDTLAGIERLYLSVNAQQAIAGNYCVNAIELNGLKINYIIDNDSISNFDFLMAPFVANDTTVYLEEQNNDSIPLRIDIQQLLLKNILCTYFDSTSHIGASILIPEISITANVDNDNYSASSKGHITIKDVRYGNYNTELMQQSSIDYDLSYNDGTVQLNNILFSSDGVRLELYGEAMIDDTIILNTNIKESFVDIGQLIRYAPQAMLKEAGLVDAQGIIRFSSSIAGAYNDTLMPEIKAQFKLENIAIETTDYPAITALNGEGYLTNGHLRNNSTTELEIKHCALATAQSGITARVKLKNLDHPSYDFHSQGHLSFDEISNLLPDSLVDYLSGKINWNISSYGTIPSEIDETFTDQMLAQTAIELSTEGLSTKMDSTLCIEQLNTAMRYNKRQLTVDSLNVFIPDYDIAIQDLNTAIRFAGPVHDLSQLRIAIEHFSVESDSAFLTLNGQINNLEAPEYNLEANADINLSRIKRFIPDSIVTSLSGRVKGHLKSAASLHLDSIESLAMPIAFEQSALQLEFDNIDLQTPDSLYGISDFSLAMAMQNDTIDLDQFSGNYKGNAFNIFNTQITNAYKTALLNQKEVLKIRTHMALGDIDLSTFEPFMLVDSTATTDTSTTAPINYTMDIKGDITMNSFYIEEYFVDTSMTIRDLNLSNYSTKFRITDSTYIADSMIFNAFEGQINSSFRYDIKADKEVVAMKSHVDSMDIKNLLTTMDNFGQKDLTAENINGQLSADFFGEAFIVGDSIPMDRLRAQGDLTLVNGGVYNFEPVEELSRFTGLKELDNIEFQTVNTQFFLFKGATYIPKTSIVSTALDANFYGMQSLDEDYEYHIEMFLGDVLTGKSENLMKRQEKAAEGKRKEVNRNGVELKAQSLDGKTKYGFDNKKAQETMTKTIRLKERVLNLVFHPNLFDFSTEINDKTN